MKNYGILETKFLKKDIDRRIITYCRKKIILEWFSVKQNTCYYTLFNY